MKSEENPAYSGWQELFFALRENSYRRIKGNKYYVFGE